MIKSEVSEVMGPWGYPQILHIFGFSKEKNIKNTIQLMGYPHLSAGQRCTIPAFGPTFQVVGLLATWKDIGVKLNG